MTQHSGTVRVFHAHSGFGFITPDDPALPDVFVHATAIQAGEWGSELASGQRVLFSIRQAPDGPRAVHVIPGGYRTPRPARGRTGRAVSPARRVA